MRAGLAVLCGAVSHVAVKGLTPKISNRRKIWRGAGKGLQGLRVPMTRAYKTYLTWAAGKTVR